MKTLKYEENPHFFPNNISNSGFVVSFPIKSICVMYAVNKAW